MADISDTLATLSERATDADREAAASYYYSAGGAHNIARDIREGRKDNWFRVQAFVTHRRNVITEAIRTGQLVPVPSVERVENQQKPCKNCGFLPDSAD